MDDRFSLANIEGGSFADTFQAKVPQQGRFSISRKEKKKKKKKKKPKVKNTFNLLCHFSTPPVLSLVVPDSRLGTVDPQHGSLCNPALTHEEIENRATDRNEAKEASTVAGTAPSHDRI